MGREKVQRRVGRKPIDDLGSMNELQRALDASMARRGEKMEPWRQSITRDYQRSKHFQGKDKK